MKSLMRPKDDGMLRMTALTIFSLSLNCSRFSKYPLLEGWHTLEALVTLLLALLSPGRALYTLFNSPVRVETAGL